MLVLAEQLVNNTREKDCFKAIDDPINTWQKRPSGLQFNESNEAIWQDHSLSIRNKNLMKQCSCSGAMAMPISA